MNKPYLDDLIEQLDDTHIVTAAKAHLRHRWQRRLDLTLRRARTEPVIRIAHQARSQGGIAETARTTTAAVKVFWVEVAGRRFNNITHINVHDYSDVGAEEIEVSLGFIGRVEHVYLDHNGCDITQWRRFIVGPIKNRYRQWKLQRKWNKQPKIGLVASGGPAAPFAPRYDLFRVKPDEEFTPTVIGTCEIVPEPYDLPKWWYDK